MTPNIKHARESDVDQNTDINNQRHSGEANQKNELPENQVHERHSTRRRLEERRPQATITIHSYIPPYLAPYLCPYYGDFCVSSLFHSNLIAQVMAEGFLPIAAPGYYLLPKLHKHRSVIPLPDSLHISKSTRRKSKRFSLTINQSFEAVVAACREQHGPQCWLYPPLVEAFADIHHGNVTTTCVLKNTSNSSSSSPTSTTETATKVSACPVRLYSIEVWDTEQGKQLVAGELGYTVGSIYTSLTGFSKQDSAGSVQLAALGRLLCQHSFTLWDLGMDMEYKRTLGAQLMPRSDFVEWVHRVRTRDADRVLPVLEQSRNCRDVIDNSTVPSREVMGQANEN